MRRRTRPHSDDDTAIKKFAAWPYERRVLARQIAIDVEFDDSIDEQDKPRVRKQRYENAGFSFVQILTLSIWAIRLIRFIREHWKDEKPSIVPMVAEPGFGDEDDWTEPETLAEQP